MIRRRQFITLLGGAAARSLAARAQQPAMPVVAFVNGATADNAPRNTSAFRKGLSETGFLDGQNLSVEYHWMAGQYERVPALIRSEEHTSELQSLRHLVCRLLLEKKK